MRTSALLLLLVGVLGLGHATTAQLARSPEAEWEDGIAPARSAESESRSLQRAPLPADVALAHVVGGRATLYNRSDSTAPVGTVPVRTPVHRLNCADAWCRVRTETGRTGFMPAAAVSNVWIHISKPDRRLFLYRGPRLIESFAIDVGYNTFADKKRKGSPAQRDHWRTPEGTFYVVDKRPRSEFYKALVLNYPTTADAERGLRQGLISQSEYRAIVRAQQERRMPPMGTELGGWIEIHGEGTGGATNWTQGCVAVRNAVMNTLWGDVKVGTPVLIE
jgi:lipoprotein-anchoring transpeptidase ErfK/SrfK